MAKGRLNAVPSGSNPHMGHWHQPAGAPGGGRPATVKIFMIGDQPVGAAV